MLGSDPQNERSVVLAPGQSVDGRQTSGVLVSKSDSTKVPGIIATGSGKHFLQIVTHLKVSERSSRRGQKEHQQATFHWATVNSQVIEFEVPRNPPLQDCTSTK